MNIKNIEKSFKKYVCDYNLKDYNINLKYKHSFRVEKQAKLIAKSLKLNKEDIQLSTVIGLLHDIGRFKQLALYNTYEDTLSFDHGDYATELLFKDDLITYFDIDKKYYDIIKFAIKNHNKYSINLEELNNVEESQRNKYILHAKIIKDADKLDIIKLISSFDISPLDDFLNKTGISEEVSEQFCSGVLVKSDIIKSLPERLLSNLALYYDLNFKFSKQQFIKKHYKRLLKSYSKKMNEKDITTITELLSVFNYNINKSSQ